MQYKDNLKMAVLSICGVYGVAYLFSLQPANRIYYSVLNVLLAVGIYFLLQQTGCSWNEKGQTFVRHWKSGAVFGVAAAAILLCLIPVWLAYYPIIMSYDFHRQVNEAYKGLAWFYPLQPIAHTWIIWLFLQIGAALGSYETGMACMAVFQMALYAAVMGYAVTMIWRLAAKKWLVIISAAFFALFP